MSHSPGAALRMVAGLFGPGLDDLLESRRGRFAAHALLVLIVCGFLVGTGSLLTRSLSSAAAVLVMVAAAALLMTRHRLALFVFLAFLFAYEEFDLSSHEAFLAYGGTRTVLGVTMFGVAFMDLVAIVLFVATLVREWRRAVEAGRWRVLPADAFFVPLAAAWLWGVALGLRNTLTMSTFTWDIRDLGSVLAFYFIFSRSLASRRDVLIGMIIGAVVFSLKNIVFIGRYVTGGGMQFADTYYRLMLGSDLPLLALALTFTAAAFFIYPSMPRRRRIALSVLVVFFVVMLVAGLGKLTYVQALSGIVMIFVLHRRDVRPRAVAAVIGAAIFGVLAFYYGILGESSRAVVGYAMSSAFGIGGALKLYTDLSFGTRFFEIINIWATLSQAKAWIFGLGWGAPWREIAERMPFDGGSFSIEEQHSGIHVSAHIDAVKYLLKVGLAGTLLVYASFARFWLRGLKLYAGESRPAYRWALMGLLLMILIFGPNYVYFIRLKYLLGFALAGVAVFMEERRREAVDA
jgi:hypothetical protein